MHYFRSLYGVRLKVPIWSAPSVTAVASSFHKVKAFTGPAYQRRQELQWHKPITSSESLALRLTPPQKNCLV